MGRIMRGIKFSFFLIRELSVFGKIGGISVCVFVFSFPKYVYVDVWIGVFH